MDNRILNIIDEEGNILGEATRQEIHEKGLLHGEVHVWFYTPDRQLIFQHRAKDKETWPDLLDATVGGHVEIGDTSMIRQPSKKRVKKRACILVRRSSSFCAPPSRHITMM
jgi:isopentenyldiphosphate isomerase